MTLTVQDPYIKHVYTIPALFAFSFRLLEESDIRVEHESAAGVVTLLTITTDYTVSITDPDGGEIDVTYSGAAGFIHLTRVTDVDQERDFVNNGPLDVDNLEAGLDKLTMLYQDFSRAVLSAAAVDYKIDSSDGAPYLQLVGLVNGSNQLYTVSYGSYITGTLMALYNGIWYRVTETDAAAGQFTMGFAPTTGKEVIAQYRVAL